MKRVVGPLSLVALLVVSSVAARLIHPRQSDPRSPYDAGNEWLNFNSQPEEGTSPTALAVSQANVGKLRRAWDAALPEIVDGSPIYVNDVDTLSGKRDLLLVETVIGRLMAYDAHSGFNIWSTKPPAGPRWTTSSPAVDPDRQYAYVYALDGHIHRYTLYNGTEVGGDGWPQLVTLKGDVEKGSSALAMATAKNGKTYLYMTTSAYPDPGDEGDYQGHLVAIDLETGTQNIWNAQCSEMMLHFVPDGDDTNNCTNRQAGIWARAGVAYDAETDRIFVTTGNGVFDAQDGGNNWASSVVALNPDGSTDNGTPIDSYTPEDFQRINDLDLDLSSTTVAILPRPAGNRRIPRLGVQSGKDELIRLLNLDDLSGRGGPRNIGGELQILQVPQSGGVFTRPATWLQASTNRPWVFITNHRGTSALTLGFTKGQPTLVPRWTKKSYQGSTPILVNNVLYIAGSHAIRAIEPSTGKQLWEDKTIGDIHWQSPILVNGTLFIADQGGILTAYAIP